MADRSRSKDGRRDTDSLTLDIETPTPGHQGRSGGNLQRKVGTRDALKQARVRPTTTRVRKADERDAGETEES